jgi:6-oxo-cyclohex-1-ene-carbonyl-CoA hydrolase
MPDSTLAIAARTKPERLSDHNLVAEFSTPGVRFERRPARTPDGTVVADLYNAWIVLDNPSQFNSYTTAMTKGVILALRAASAARDIVAVVLTGSGDKAFCTGGNTKEYAEYYAGNPQEYRQYMRLFNDMVSAILGCDKPVICRVNGIRIGGGQEIGMACDFSIAQDLARLGQAGPKHGSAAIGGATDFLPLMIGMERTSPPPSRSTESSSPTLSSSPTGTSTSSAASSTASPRRARRSPRGRSSWRAARSTCRCLTRRSRSSAASCC